jgi:hypothetical protein
MTPKFSELPLRRKLKHVLKVAVCLLSFGFIYPNILND